MENSSIVEIVPEIFQKTISEGDTVLLDISVTVPKLKELKGKGIKRINKYYEDVKAVYQKYAETVMLRRKKKSISRVPLGAAVMPDSLELSYKIVENSASKLTVRWDAVEKTMGEEAVAVRYVDNWDILSGTPVIPSLTGKQKKSILREIETQVGASMSKGASFYESPRKNIRKFFKESSCARTSDGLKVYYPLYSLSPYSEGFPEFEIKGIFS